MHQFRNDYSEYAHENILNALLKASKEQNVGYGLDTHSANAEKKILEAFKMTSGKVFFLTGGTQANMVVISYLLKPYQAVVACDSGHINVHETGAVEGSGHKVYTLPNENGKLTAAALKKAFKLNTSEHMVMPKVVYISNSTETGSIYNKAELTELRQICDETGSLLFIDGARLGVALTSKENDLTLQEFASFADVFYVGGTKNGLLSGEAVVFKDEKLAEDFRYQIKNRGAMLAKGFVLGTQFEAAFTNDLYFRLARNANECAAYIKDELTKLNVKFAFESPTNQQFITLKKDQALYMMDKFGLELWEDLDDYLTIRIVTSWCTKKEDCDELITEFYKLFNK